MGCGMSSESNEIDPFSSQTMDNDKIIRKSAIRKGESLQTNFQRLDEEICALEKECSMSKLSTIVSWIEHLQIEKDLSEQEVVKGQALSKTEISQAMDHDLKSFAKVRNIANKLEIATNPVAAKQNEELFAKISKTSLNYRTIELRSAMIDHSKKRADFLLQNFNRLRELYAELDGVLASITGTTYVSELERKYDTELESCRQIRDKLGAVSEQWRISNALLQLCANSILKATEIWDLVSVTKSPTDKINLALDCREYLHSSILSFRECQNALPQVEIPFVTPRQLLEIEHLNLYLLTDLASDNNIKHIKSILEMYQKNSIRALDWLHNTYRKTVQKNCEESERNVQTIAKKLRDERVKFISIEGAMETVRFK